MMRDLSARDTDEVRDALAQQFDRFAQTECGASPLYRRLAGGIAHDRDLLHLAAPGDHGPKPNLFPGAVHYLLLTDPDDPLTAFYPSTDAGSASSSDPLPAFRAYCLAHAERIRALMQSRRVQWVRRWERVALRPRP